MFGFSSTAQNDTENLSPTRVCLGEISQCHNTFSLHGQRPFSCPFGDLLCFFDKWMAGPRDDKNLRKTTVATYFSPLFFCLAIRFETDEYAIEPYAVGFLLNFWALIQLGCFLLVFFWKRNPDWLISSHVLLGGVIRSVPFPKFVGVFFCKGFFIPFFPAVIASANYCQRSKRAKSCLWFQNSLYKISIR